MARAAPLPHATVPVGRHGVEVHLIKVFCVGQLAVRSTSLSRSAISQIVMTPWIGGGKLSICAARYMPEV